MSQNPVADFYVVPVCQQSVLDPRRSGRCRRAISVAVLLLLRAEGSDPLINVLADEWHDAVCGCADPTTRDFRDEGTACRIGDVGDRETELGGGLAGGGYVRALERASSGLADGAEAKDDDGSGCGAGFAECRSLRLLH